MAELSGNLVPSCPSAAERGQFFVHSVRTFYSISWYLFINIVKAQDILMPLQFTLHRNDQKCGSCLRSWQPKRLTDAGNRAQGNGEAVPLSNGLGTTVAKGVSIFCLHHGPGTAHPASPSTGDKGGLRPGSEDQQLMAGRTERSKGTLRRGRERSHTHSPWSAPATRNLSHFPSVLSVKRKASSA